MKTSSNMKNTFIKSISNVSDIHNVSASVNLSKNRSSSTAVYKSRETFSKNSKTEAFKNNICTTEEADFSKAIPILLPTRKASSGATVNKTEFVVVDGITPYVYIFSFCGMFKGAVPTLRPYGKITYSMETDTYYALDGHCSSNVYILNCRFEETDKISTDCSSTLTGISLFTFSGCPCINSNEYAFYQENQNRKCKNTEKLVLTSPRSVFASSKTGTYTSTIRSSCKNVFFNSFVAVENGFAEAYCKNSLEYIQISVNCKEATITVPHCISVKNLFSTDGGGIYGFFGKNYSNSYIIPIYENECINMELSNFLLGKSEA